ncbi:Basic-leucine zipper domain-containing protein [Strongyloides ratti]|uniref:Basic-leucine zipper domain-containing protein n=1 Tax=Strongyloides ratti TaxID=34506 RepID=A0A090L538_STRRB|nr:Basic-leucine zipper domain-containing protein [Strongyloides ratti]CEF63187.1 Basic-leucine zipper domain-containing protein [Strongyloides ratti]
MTSTLVPYKNTFLQKNDINNSPLYSFKQTIQSPLNFNTPYTITTSLYNLLALQNSNTKSPNLCFLNSTNLDVNHETTISKSKNIFISEPSKISFENKPIVVFSSSSENDVSDNYSSATSRRSSFSQNSPRKRIGKNELLSRDLSESVTIKRSTIKSDIHKHKKSMIRDDAYWERRRRNNDAAKRSRDSRRKKVRIIIKY